jgi:hypothetical protein
LPEIGIGAQCLTPFECEYKNIHCWKEAGVPEYSIYNVLGKAKFKQIAEETGSYQIEDLKERHYPSGNKLIDIQSYNSGNVFIDHDQVRAFLDRLVCPLYYLDYETVMHAIPLFDYTRPYQQIPFQFSLYIQKEKGGDVEHYDYLHKERTDPRPAFIKALLEHTEGQGSIIVYNQTFEKRINSELARDFPAYEQALVSLNERVIDLYAPFRSRHIYSPKQKGSASIKAVLPAFVSGLGYEDLDIAGGGGAMESYLEFVLGNIPDSEQDKLWHDLFEYCKLDTYAMVALISVLDAA